VSPLGETVFEKRAVQSVVLDHGFPEPGATTRRNITPAEAERVRRGNSIEDLYIGRNSVWGNPFKIGRDGDRKTVIRKFEEYLEASGLGRKVAELRGCVLVCHCAKEQPCHGDVLIRRADAGRKAPEEGREQGQDHALDNEDAQPMRDVDDSAVEQDQRKSWSPRDGTVSGSIGQGSPRVAEFMGSCKAFADGGGLCSPGRWAPEARVVQDYGLNEVRDTLYGHFQRVTREEKGDMTPTMNFALRLASGKYQESPFKEEHLEDARKDMASKLGSDNDILAVAPGQAFRLDLVARLLQKVGDPDWDFLLQLKEGSPWESTRRWPVPPRYLMRRSSGSLMRLTDQGSDTARTTSQRRATWNKSKSFLEKNRSSVGWLSWTRPMRGRSTVTGCLSRPSR